MPFFAQAREERLDRRGQRRPFRFLQLQPSAGNRALTPIFDQQRMDAQAKVRKAMLDRLERSRTARPLAA